MPGRRPVYNHGMSPRGRPWIPRTISAAALAGALALLAGCNNVTTFRSEAAGNPNLQLEAPSAAMNGSNLALIRNNPFPGDPAGLAIVGVMNANNPMRMYRFAPTPQPNWNSYTVILAFGELPAGNVTLCQNTTLPPRPMPQGETAVIADLCIGPRLITEVYGHCPAVRGPDDPQFAALVGGVLEDLFAQRQPHYPRAVPHDVPFRL